MRLNKHSTVSLLHTSIVILAVLIFAPNRAPAPTIITPPNIKSIVVNGTSVTINFTGNVGSPASVFTLVSSTTPSRASSYLPDGGSVITLISPGIFKASTSVGGPARFYRIRMSG